MELSIISNGGVDVVDSRDVAEAIGKNHKDLLRDIRNYADIMEKSNERKFAPVDFFISSTYVDGKGESRPRFLLTKKGCDMVANKMTGEKGVLFTALYVTAFEKMREQQAQRPMSASEMFLAQAQLNVAAEKRIAALEERARSQDETIQQVVSIFSVPTIDRESWQVEMKKSIDGYCAESGKSYPVVYGELYKELERVAGVSLESRLTRKRNRMKEAGTTYSERQAVSKLTVIADDKKLRQIFEGICRRKFAQQVARPKTGRWGN